MPANHVLIEKITVGSSGAASVTFANIPQTGYTDLSLMVSARSSLAQIYGGGNMIFNDDATAGNYVATRRLYGTGSSVESGAYNTNNIDGTNYNGNSATVNTFGTRSIYIPNYTGSQQKSVSIDETTENNATTAYMGFFAALWKSSSAINKITLRNNGAETFASGSTFYLYGVAKLNTTPAIAPKATGGNTIMTDGTYWYHAFRSSGTFTPATALNCDVLVVAGGGGGGAAGQYYPGGGAGAGGVLAHSAQSLAATNYTVTIGAGGSVPTTNNGSQGSNSQFASLTASVGGGYGSNIATSYGGSGGSAGSGAGSGANLASATSGQGNQAGHPNGFYSGGGGGGAGSTGFNASSNSSGGAGGAGVNTYTGWGSLTAAFTATGTGVSGYIAGGGGGGGSVAYGTVTQALGGSGGGGNGGTTGSTGVTNGTANTGGGGGAGSGTNATVPPWGIGGSGGSGLVIVRYPV